jgi:hypothetical protein
LSARARRRRRPRMGQELELPYAHRRGHVLTQSGPRAIGGACRHSWGRAPPGPRANAAGAARRRRPREARALACSARAAGEKKICRQRICRIRRVASRPARLELALARVVAGRSSHSPTPSPNSSTPNNRWDGREQMSGWMR